ncbi:hypothetical protein RJT34_04691 [Clitoria ternatea]|uniref:Pentatricopeptide repeat-containing protein n=1 Tax=Clitoria ternatea TaxID=43366 RepID=A0AAN9KM42_CLITE
MELHLLQPNDSFIHNQLLHLYANCGKLFYAQNLFDNMTKRDVYSWNALLSAYAKLGMVFRQSIESSCESAGRWVSAYQYSYINAWQACSQLLDLRHGKQIHGRIVVADFGNTSEWNAVTDMYAKCGDIDRHSGCLKRDIVTVSNIRNAYLQCGRKDDARNMFSKLLKKNEICWTTMIVGYAQNGREEDALMLFGDMLHGNVRPDCYTISSVVSSSAKLASLFHSQVVHGKVIVMGFDNNMPVSSALVDMYCKCGVTLDAWVIFEAMPIRNVITWNALVLGYAQNGQVLEALALYEKMQLENFKLDNITFVGIFSACINADMVNEGWKYFDSISEQGMISTLDHYACMVTIFGRSGTVDKAVDLIKGMPHEADYLIWSTLLSVCAKCDQKTAELAASHLFELDPHNAGPYIILSNLHAACGRWKDVAVVRSHERKECKEVCSYSWVEVENEVHRFVSEDHSHPEVDRIYGELIRLIPILQQLRYNPDTSAVLHNVGDDEKFRSISYHSEKLALGFCFT